MSTLDKKKWRLDYGCGNRLWCRECFSLQSSLHAIGEEAIVTDDKTKIRAADRVILPGVGAFGDAADKLRERPFRFRS